MRLHEELLEHARVEAPREACGVIVTDKRDERAPLFAWRGRNIAAGEHDFLLDPRDQFRFMRAIENQGLELAAIYHSHPRGPAALSDADRALAFYPVPLVVVSLQPVAVCWFEPVE